MERPIFKPIGTLEEDLDTPALVVDLDKLERNIEIMHSFFRDKDTKLRPHIGSHGSPTIAHMQLAAGGTVGGITTSTLGQAEIFAASGFTDIFIANILVTPIKITRLCALAQRVKTTVVVDSSKNVNEIATAATNAGVSVNVVLNINSQPSLTGIEPGDNAVKLATLASRSSSLNFAGLMTYERSVPFDEAEYLDPNTHTSIQRVLDTSEALKISGIDVAVISVGGTYNYELAGRIPGVTEIPAGSYALMDENYRQKRPQFDNAARIMSCVTSTPEANQVVTDAGRKAIGGDAGNPSVIGLPGAKVRGLSAEHGTIDFDQAITHDLKLGDRVWFIPKDIAGSVNVHDYIHAVRAGKLEAVWELPARGHYR